MWIVREFCAPRSENIHQVCYERFHGRETITASKRLRQGNDYGKETNVATMKCLPFSISGLAVTCTTFNQTRVLCSTRGNEAATETACDDIRCQ